MPMIYLKVPEVGTRIIDPVTEQLIESVLGKLGIRQYFGDSIFIDNGRTAASQSDDGLDNINLQRNRCDVKVETLYNPSEQFWDTTTDASNTASGSAPRYTPQYQKIFFDRDAQVSIQELTMPFGLVLTFDLEFLTYDAAQQAISALIAQNYGTTVNNTHDVVFSYPVTMQMMTVLYAVYKCKQDYAQKTFYQYVQDMATANYSFNVRTYDIGKPNPVTQYVVKRQQINCQALLEFTQNEPEPKREEKLPIAYTLQFVYRLQFGRPNTLQISIPAVVENHALPHGLFVSISNSSLPLLPQVMQTSFFTNTGRDLYSRYSQKEALVRFPAYDDYVIPLSSQLRIYKFNPLLIGITTLDSPVTVVDFTALGNVSLHAFVRAILSQHSNADVIGYQGLFNITVFSNDLPLDPSLLIFDPQTLQVSFSASRIKNTYRIVLSEQTNLKMLDPKWYPVLLQYRYFFPLTIARNLNFLCTMNYFTITSDDALCRLVRHVIALGQMDNLLTSLITAGAASYEVRQFTQTIEQFADYICNTKAGIIAGETLLDDVSRTVFDAFCDACVQAGYITETARPQKYLRTPKGYPYGPGQGGTDSLQIPLRVFNITLAPHKAT